MITKIEILPIRPSNGLIAFASIEIDNRLYISSIGIHRKLNGSGYRITYPGKKIGKHNITICHPIEPKLSREIEHSICNKAQELFSND